MISSKEAVTDVSRAAKTNRPMDAAEPDVSVGPYDFVTLADGGHQCTARYD